MPVEVKKRNRLWRLLDPDGNVERTRKGAAVDGGGHASRAAALAQRRAIEARKRRTAAMVKRG